MIFPTGELGRPSTPSSDISPAYKVCIFLTYILCFNGCWVFSEYHSHEFMLVGLSVIRRKILNNDRSFSSILIFKYISFLSQASATGLLLNLTSTSNNSFWSFESARIASFRDSPSHLAKQSNAMRTTVVVLSHFTIGKCGKYQDDDWDHFV